MSNADLAALTGQQLGRPISEQNYRQVLHRARVLFADNLLRAVEHSLGRSNHGSLGG